MVMRIFSHKGLSHLECIYGAIYGVLTERRIKSELVRHAQQKSISLFIILNNGSLS